MVDGLPDGLRIDELNNLALKHLEELPSQVRHINLAGWKTSGTYRVILRTNRGRFWSVIFKKTAYTLDEIPALSGLSVSPGRPEYSVYDSPSESLKAYLPEIYHCQELVPGVHYRYLMGDLRPRYRPVAELDDTLRVIAELPALHATLREWTTTPPTSELLQYDRDFSVSLLNYAHGSLERYVRSTNGESVRMVLDQWEQIADVYLESEFRELQSVGPVHGDCNRSNVHLLASGKDGIKLVDWEWMGVGVPHMDLVSLLKGMDPGAERQGLSRYAAENQDLSLEEHTQIYRWCELERGLLDGAFLANQVLDVDRKVAWMPGYIHYSMQQILRSCAEIAV